MSETAEAEFAAFDFKGDPRWKHYLENITLPDDDPARLNRLKRKWFRTNLNANLEESKTSTSSSASEPKQSASENTTKPEAKPSPAAGSASPAGKTVRGLVFSAETFRLALNVWLVAFALLYVVTSIPAPRFSFTCFRRVILGGLLKYFLLVKDKHGLPNFGTLRKIWGAVRGTDPAAARSLSNVAFDRNAHYVFMCSLFITSTPVLPIVVPITTSAAYKVVQYQSEFLQLASPSLASRFAPAFQKVLSRQNDILRWNATAEVVTMLYLVMQLFTPYRNFILIFVYGQFLRVRYISNDYSRAAFGQLVRRLDALLLHRPVVGGVYSKIKALLSRLVAMS